MTSKLENFNSLSYYRKWQRFIDTDHPKLDPKCKRGMLLAFAHVTAKMDKSNGQNLYPGNQVIADALECTRDTVAQYKAEAIRVGWFEYTGTAVGRAKVFRICIPDRAPYEYERQPRRVNTRNLRQFRMPPDGSEIDPKPSERSRSGIQCEAGGWCEPDPRFDGIQCIKCAGLMQPLEALPPLG
jgi:hypothetical protein